MPTENQISDLINHSGRLRMLSHRVGMMITFIANYKGSGHNFRSELPITLTKFESSLEKVITAIREEIFFRDCFSEYSSDKTLDIESKATRFISQARSLHQQIESDETPSENAIYNLLSYIADDLLVTLNELVQFFEFALSKVSENQLADIRRLASEIIDSLEEVDQINLSTKILSFNANVEAARAGDLGKGFAVVSKEMNSLSEQTKLVSERVKKSVEAFVQALGA